MVMFENDRNTRFINDIKSDFIEKSFAKLETAFSELFKIALSDNFLDVLGPQGISIFRQYFSIQFWRLPILDHFADNFIKKLDLQNAPSPILINGRR
jgi:hypothetical protein